MIALIALAIAALITSVVVAVIVRRRQDQKELEAKVARKRREKLSRKEHIWELEEELGIPHDEEEETDETGND